MSEPYCNFYVGQRVTLIAKDAVGDPVIYANVTIARPKSGVVYTIRDIYWNPILKQTGIRLVEIVNPPAPWADGFMENGWWHVHFRPVTDISNLQKLLTNVPTELEPV